MAYRKIDQRIWDDERFVDMSFVERMIWLYIITGRHTTTLPGLWIVGLAEIAEAVRAPLKSVQATVEKLEKMGRVVFNPRVRVLRVPNAPRYNRPENARVVNVWFNMWRSLPECQQKYDHLESLRDAVFARRDEQSADSSPSSAGRSERVTEQWTATFGKVDVPARFRREAAKSSTSHEVTTESSRTIRSRSANSPYIYTAPAPSGISGSSGDKDPEIPPDTARAREVSPPPCPRRGLGAEAKAILAKMWSHECLREVATEQAAEGLAVRVVSGGASLADAERGIDEVAYAYAAEKDALPKTPTALLGWLSNRIGWEARERKSMPGRRDARPAFRHTGPAGPNPAVAPFAPLPPDARPWTPED